VGKDFSLAFSVPNIATSFSLSGQHQFAELHLLPLLFAIGRASNSKGGADRNDNKEPAEKRHIGVCCVFGISRSPFTQAAMPSKGRVQCSD
jgi:hypothetical protein